MLTFSPSFNKEITLNDLRKALIGYIVSKKDQDNFIFTIDDTKEVKEAFDRENIDILKKFAIEAEQTIYRSKNKNIYQNLALKLLQEKKAFVCFCNSTTNCKNSCAKLSQEEISRLKDNNTPFNIKVFKPKNNIVLNDKIDGVKIIEIKSMDEFTILDSKAEASDIFVKASDCMLFAINSVIEDSSKIEDSAKILYILNLLDYNEKVEFIHLPLLQKSEDITIKSLFKQGFLPDTIINYLISTIIDIDKKIFYLPEAINRFENDLFIQKDTKFNIDILKDLNRKHLQLMDDKKLSSIFGFADSNIGKIAKEFLNEASTINELISALKDIFSTKDCSNRLVKDVIEVIQKAPYINDFNKFKAYIEKNSDIKEDELQDILREILIGSKNSNIDLEKIYKLINPYLLEVAKCQ